MFPLLVKVKDLKSMMGWQYHLLIKNNPILHHILVSNNSRNHDRGSSSKSRCQSRQAKSYNIFKHLKKDKAHFFVKGIYNPQYLPNDFFALSTFLENLKPSHLNLSIQICPQPLNQRLDKSKCSKTQACVLLLFRFWCKGNHSWDAKRGVSPTETY